MDQTGPVSNPHQTGPRTTLVNYFTSKQTEPKYGIVVEQLSIQFEQSSPGRHPLYALYTTRSHEKNHEGREPNQLDCQE